jgi:hypothetical protein
VRPANHPALRLAAGAAMIANAASGLSADLLEAVRRGDDPIALLRQLSCAGGERLLGQDRAVGIVANTVIPFAFAVASSTSDPELSEAAAGLWERLPGAEANEVTRRARYQVAGDARLPGLGARGQQGLIQLDQTLCGPRRCFECPIAHAALDHVASVLPST